MFKGLNVCNYWTNFGFCILYMYCFLTTEPSNQSNYVHKRLSHYEWISNAMKTHLLNMDSDYFAGLILTEGIKNFIMKSKKLICNGDFSSKSSFVNYIPDLTIKNRSDNIFLWLTLYANLQEYKTYIVFWKLFFFHILWSIYFK